MSQSIIDSASTTFQRVIYPLFDELKLIGKGTITFTSRGACEKDVNCNYIYIILFLSIHIGLYFHILSHYMYNTFNFSIPICLYHSISPFLYVYIFQFPCSYMSITFYFSLPICLYLSISLFLHVYNFLLLSSYMSIFFYFSLPICLCLSISLSL